jgi:hypothetical protein
MHFGIKGTFKQHLLMPAFFRYFCQLPFSNAFCQNAVEIEGSNTNKTEIPA